ncbi:diacylglycerol/lipid kinase family protein [Streptococcus hongkongensis]|nr:diacylglycerol kinase [Streptococcus uberis]
MKNALLIVNSASGGEKAESYKEAAIKKLKGHFEHVDVKITEKLGDGKAFAREAADKGYHSVFVMGGDGTVNEGISGIAEQTYKPHFGFFPLGTVNDLARSLGIPINPEEAIANMNLEDTQELDIGKINQSYFTNIVAIGNIPESINHVDDNLKTKLGPIAYFVSGLQHVLKNKSYEFQVVYDGKKARVEGSLLLIALTNSVGGYDNFTPDAKVDDGYLHLILTKDKNFLETLEALPGLLKKDQTSKPLVSYKRAKKVNISVKSADLQTNVDGDQGDHLPVSLAILPKHIKVYTCKKD